MGDGVGEGREGRGGGVKGERDEEKWMKRNE